MGMDEDGDDKFGALMDSIDDALGAPDTAPAEAADTKTAPAETATAETAEIKAPGPKKSRRTKAQIDHDNAELARIMAGEASTTMASRMEPETEEEPYLSPATLAEMELGRANVRRASGD